MTEVKVNTIDKVFELMKVSQFSLFRGLSKKKYHLETSLSRNGGDEISILRNFAKYAALEDASVWKQMVYGQHYGLPTRLLDWSHSPLVALYFATSEHDPQDIYKNDCVVWQIDAKEINSFLPEKYKTMLNQNELFFTLHKLEQEKVELKDIDNKGAVLLLEPPAIDGRIINQFSYFSVVPNDVEMETFLKRTSKTRKYIISKNIRAEIKRMLDRLNVSERTLFPGYDGVATQLGRFYKNYELPNGEKSFIYSNM